MYKQSLYRIVPNHIKSSVLKKKNKHKKWEYGYNEEHDMVVISKTGEVGEVYETLLLLKEINGWLRNILKSSRG